MKLLDIIIVIFILFAFGGYFLFPQTTKKILAINIDASPFRWLRVLSSVLILATAPALLANIYFFFIESDIFLSANYPPIINQYLLEGNVFVAQLLGLFYSISFFQVAPGKTLFWLIALLLAVTSICRIFNYRPVLFGLLQFFSLYQVYAAQSTIGSAGYAILCKLVFFLVVIEFTSIHLYNNNNPRIKLTRVWWPAAVLVPLQVMIIYVQSSFYKVGETWRDGLASYYAMSLEAYNKFDYSYILAKLYTFNILPFFTWSVYWWERFFFFAFIGYIIQVLRLNGIHNLIKEERKGGSFLFLAMLLIMCLLILLANDLGMGTKPSAFEVAFWLASCVFVSWLAFMNESWLGQFLRRTLFNKKYWLLFGVLFHGMIFVFMQLGIFAEVMFLMYLSFLLVNKKSIS